MWRNLQLASVSWPYLGFLLRCCALQQRTLKVTFKPGLFLSSFFFHFVSVSECAECKCDKNLYTRRHVRVQEKVFMEDVMVCSFTFLEWQMKNSIPLIKRERLCVCVCVGAWGFEVCHTHARTLWLTTCLYWWAFHPKYFLSYVIFTTFVTQFSPQNGWNERLPSLSKGLIFWGRENLTWEHLKIGGALS